MQVQYEDGDLFIIPDSDFEANYLKFNLKKK